MNCSKFSPLCSKNDSSPYPERYHPPYNYVLRLLQGLNQEGRFPGRQMNQQRRRANMFDDDTELQVLAYIRTNPRSSIRHVAREIGVSYGYVQIILKKHKMHRYKINFVQHLRAGDSIHRLEFIAWFNIKLYDNPMIVNHILWSDKSKFTNNVGGKLIGPFFYDGTLNGRRYLNFLINELPRLLDDVLLDTRERMFFQQDGAPVHNAIIVRRHLDQIFPNHWIGTFSVIPWPARSPDLTPLDFFLWGYLKPVVYVDPPVNLQDLKNKIQAACDILSEKQIKAATSTEFLRRLELCLEHNGESFEQFIR
ncbi:hypothetical protein QTP88_002426 [Uroleucon formosanum]